MIVWYDHKEGKESFPDGEKVVVRRFPFERGKGVVCLFEEVGNGFWCHRAKI